MYFKDHEKLVYRPPGLDPGHKGYDPIAVDRALTLATGADLNALIEAWKAPGSNTGDVSPEGRKQAYVEAARAEEALAKAARFAFGLPDFPDCTDGTALEYLCHYLEYMQGKDCGLGTTPPSPGPSQVYFPPSQATMASSPSTPSSSGTGRTG